MINTFKRPFKVVNSHRHSRAAMTHHKDGVQQPSPAVSPPGARNEPESTIQDVFAFAAHLQRLHPANRHVRDKIRQQLQVLRDLGLIEFLGRGGYRSL